MNCVSVCDGIGAVHVAWRPLGWQCLWTSEIARFPIAVVKHHYPEIENLGDITQITEEQAVERGPVDLLVGGTPCQGFSLAGTRGGLADPRSNLAIRFLWLAGVLRPRWIVFENVPGLYSSASHNTPADIPNTHYYRKKGKRKKVETYHADERSDFGQFLAAFSQLGYGIAFRCLDAEYFGVAQRRNRVFAIGHIGDWRRAAAVLFDTESVSGHPPPRREERTAIAIPVALCAGASGPVFQRTGNTRGQDAVAACLNSGGNNDGFRTEPGEHLVAVPLSGNPYGDNESRETMLVAHALRSEGFDASEDGTGRGTPIVAIGIDRQNSASTGDLAGTLRGEALAKQSYGNAVVFDCKQSGQGGEVAPPLRALNHDASHANAGGQLAVQRGMTVRRLTVVECCRLMGFSDTYLHIPTPKWRKIAADEAAYLAGHGVTVKQDGEQWLANCPADSVMYRAIGNSMVTNVMSWIGKRIELVERRLGNRP